MDIMEKITEPPTEKIILHVDMDAFFVSVEEVLNPKLRGKPVIVGGPPDGRGVVSSASYKAREKGVRSAMPLAEAKRRCPDAIFLSGSHGVYSSFSKRVMAIMERFTPEVSPVSVDEAYLDLTGCERTHRGGPFIIAEKIHDTLMKETGLPCSIGIATSRIVAKIAANEAKPNGILSILPGYEAAYLAPLPIRKMPGVGPSTEKELTKMGVRVIGDLTALEPATLSNAFGKWADGFARKAQGRDGQKSGGRKDHALSIGKEVTYAADTDDPEALEATLSYLSEKVAGRMRDAGLSFRRVTVKLRYADFNTVTHSKTVDLLSNDPSKVYKTARALLKSLYRRRASVRLVGVTVSSLAGTGRQIGLFDKPEKKELLNKSLDTARERYGFEAVLTARSSLFAAVKGERAPTRKPSSGEKKRHG